MWIDRLIGERIRTRRSASGVSLESLQRRTQIDLSLLAAYECGKARMQRRHLSQIAQALDMTPERLLAGDCAPAGRGFPRVSAQRDTVRITHPQ